MAPEIDTACILTTEANTATAAVHDRMPVILDARISTPGSIATR